MQALRSDTLYSSYWRQQKSQIASLVEKSWILDHCSKHLHSSLRVADVGCGFHASLAQDEIEKGRLVIFCKFLETEVPVFLVHIGV